MKRLIQVSNQFNSRPFRQDIHMCVLRTDYLLDQRTKSLKLVEYNTIACSFGCLSQKVKEIQDYLIDKYGRELTELNYQDCCCKPNSMIQDLHAEPYIDRLVD